MDVMDSRGVQGIELQHSGWGILSVRRSMHAMKLFPEVSSEDEACISIT